jgi:hypothetical protein
MPFRAQQPDGGAAARPQSANQNPMGCAHGRPQRSFSVARPSSAQTIDTIQKRITTEFSAASGDRPSARARAFEMISKWWWIGAMRNKRRPRQPANARQLEPGGALDHHAARFPTNTSPTISSVSSCLIRMATMAMVPPSARLPVSPMNTLAG